MEASDPFPGRKDMTGILQKPPEATDPLLQY
jgi:hypothetical protein